MMNSQKMKIVETILLRQIFSQLRLAFGSYEAKVVIFISRKQGLLSRSSLSRLYFVYKCFCVVCKCHFILMNHHNHDNDYHDYILAFHAQVIGNPGRHGAWDSGSIAGLN